MSLICVFTLLTSVGVNTAWTNNTDSQTLSYTGHSVVRVWPDHAGHVRALATMDTEDGFEFWRRPTRPRQPVDIRVSPNKLSPLLRRFRRNALRYKVTVPDLQEKISRERRSWDESIATGTFNISIYHTFEEIMAWMDDMAQECGPICATVTIGTSYEGRDIKVMRLGLPQENKPIIWIDAGIHAREWIAPATALYLIEKLILQQQTDFTVRYLLNQYVWYILPLDNPDGYAYTWSTDRMWRKTRKPHEGSDCAGADPNRNWGYHWAGPGTSGDPCSENYRGPEPFSEPETRAISSFLWSLKGRIKLYLTLHSYGQFWLTPWGFTYHVPEDYTEMMLLGRRVVDMIQSDVGSRYRIGASSRMLCESTEWQDSKVHGANMGPTWGRQDPDLASGGSDDWAKGVLGVKYSYTVELRDTGEHGFVLPAYFIPITGEEMFSAIRILAIHIIQEMHMEQARGTTAGREDSDGMGAG